MNKKLVLISLIALIATPLVGCAKIEKEQLKTRSFEELFGTEFVKHIRCPNIGDLRYVDKDGIVKKAFLEAKDVEIVKSIPNASIFNALFIYDDTFSSFIHLYSNGYGEVTDGALYKSYKFQMNSSSAVSIINTVYGLLAPYQMEVEMKRNELRSECTIEKLESTRKNNQVSGYVNSTHFNDKNNEVVNKITTIEYTYQPNLTNYLGKHLLEVEFSNDNYFILGDTYKHAIVSMDFNVKFDWDNKSIIAPVSIRTSACYTLKEEDGRALYDLASSKI